MLAYNYWHALQHRGARLGAKLQPSFLKKEFAEFFQLPRPIGDAVVPTTTGKHRDQPHSATKPQRPKLSQPAMDSYTRTRL